MLLNTYLTQKPLRISRRFSRIEHLGHKGSLWAGYAYIEEKVKHRHVSSKSSSASSVSSGMLLWLAGYFFSKVIPSQVCRRVWCGETSYLPQLYPARRSQFLLANFITWYLTQIGIRHCSALQLVRLHTTCSLLQVVHLCHKPFLHPYLWIWYSKLSWIHRTLS